jgi:energy-coupling factor transporter ATP-binding protein EcfA2
MLEKIVLMHSANFNFLEINLEKDLFFLGDNGSGKTTLIRAIQYLFNGDVTNLGIPTDKDGFKEYYFKEPNSYIIYIFNDFFIFMYKSGGEIIKLFSKQEFSISEIISNNNEIYDFNKIRQYIRSPKFKIPSIRGVNEYRDIIYGQNKKYLDFKLTTIKDYNTFIKLFNQIFNIDKSIIDSKSIKQAIEKTLDYEKSFIDFDYKHYLDEINKLQSEYRFFKKFEEQSNNIDNSKNLKDDLVTIENSIKIKKSEISFKSKKEIEIGLILNKKIKSINNNIEKNSKYIKSKNNILIKCNSKITDIRDYLKFDF